MNPPNHSPYPSRLPRWLALAALFAGTSSAAADGSASCRKVRARAQGDAALLFAPVLQLQGIRFPQSGAADTGVTTGNGYQLRMALSYSLVDLYKGFRVLRVADAQCRQQEALERAQQLLHDQDDLGRLEASRRQAAYLDGKQGEWERIVAEGEERLARQVTPLIDTQEIRLRRTELERKRIQAHHDAERLALRGELPADLDVAALAGEVDSATMGLEREVSHLRTLDAWSVTLSGGAIPQGGVSDWFGVVQLGFNLGGVVRYGREARYLEARAEELRLARYEARDQLMRLQAQVRVTLLQARRERVTLDAQLSSLRAIERALSKADAPNAAHALAIVRLDAINVEADVVFLSTLVEELSRLRQVESGT